MAPGTARHIEIFGVGPWTFPARPLHGWEATQEATVHQPRTMLTLAAVMTIFTFFVLTMQSGF